MGFRFGGKMARVGHVTGYTSGTQTRHNIGFRWAGNLPSFEYDLGGVYQFGSFHGESGPERDISAYALHTILGWRGPKKPGILLSGYRLSCIQVQNNGVMVVH